MIHSTPFSFRGVTFASEKWGKMTFAVPSAAQTTAKETQNYSSTGFLKILREEKLGFNELDANTGSVLTILACVLQTLLVSEI